MAPLCHAGLISGALAATAPLDRACSTSFMALSRAWSASPPPCAVLPASAVPLALTATTTSRRTNASSSVRLPPLRIFPVKERQTFLLFAQLAVADSVSVTVRTLALGRLQTHSLQPSIGVGQNRARVGLAQASSCPWLPSTYCRMAGYSGDPASRGLIVLVILLHAQRWPALLAAPAHPPIHPAGLSHRPWWHSRGHLSDYATCRPRGEDDAALQLDLEKLAAAAEPHDAARAPKPAHFREEFLNIAAEVPELACLFVSKDVQAELLPPDRPSKLPLGLHSGSLYQRLRVLHLERSAERSAAGAPERGTSIGYEMQRVWLDDMFGDLGGPRGCRIVQRAMHDARHSTALPAPPPDLADAEPSHFYLPAFLCHEIEIGTHSSGPETEPLHMLSAVDVQDWQDLHTHGPGQGGTSRHEIQIHANRKEEIVTTKSKPNKQMSSLRRRARKRASDALPAVT